jgi:hypothetical protein
MGHVISPCENLRDYYTNFHAPQEAKEQSCKKTEAGFYPASQLLEDF